jgi:GAF domain-containing protein
MNERYLENLVRLAAEIADAHAASLFTVDGDFLLPYVIYNLPPDYVAGIGSVRVGAQCCGRAVEQKKPWIVTDMLTDPLFAEGREGAAKSVIRAAFSVPVFDSGNAIASLACHYTIPHIPTALDIERNEHFAKLIAITLKDAVPSNARKTIFVQPRDMSVRDLHPVGAF